LSQFLIDGAVSRGVKLHKPAQATTVVEDVNGTIAAVKIVSLDSKKESIIPCTDLVLSMGPWDTTGSQRPVPLLSGII
jgi:hypothetical protein